MPRAPIGPKIQLATSLALLTLAALALRLRGIGHGLPVAVEQDCKIPHQVELLERRDPGWKTDPEFRWYPLLVAQIASAAGATEPAPRDAPLEEHLAAASAPQLKVRVCVALLASLLVPGTYLLARRFLGPAPSLFAAAVVAASLLHANFSQQSRPHAVAGFTFLAAVLGALRLRRRGDATGFGLAGLGAALAIGTLQSGIAVLPAAVVAFALREVRGRRRWLDWRAVALLAPLALAVPFFYPFAVWGERAPRAASGRVAQRFLEFHAGPRLEIDVGEHRIFLDEFAGRGFAELARILASHEPVLAALALLGITAWLARGRAARAAVDPGRRRDFAVALAFALPYALALGLYSRTYERFAIPLLPYLACGAAFAASAAARRWPRLARARVAVPLAAAALALPAYATWRLGSIRSAPHTTELATDWVRAHATPDDDIALWPQLDLRLARRPEGFASWMGDISKQFTWVWSRYQALLPDGHGPEPLWRLRWWTPKLKQMVDDPDGYVREQGGRWVVIEVYTQNRTHPAGTRAREALQRAATLVARFSPDARDGYSEHPLGYQDETSVPPPCFLARVLQAERAGPVIEIYRLPAD
jgi:hypothetical protein